MFSSSGRGGEEDLLTVASSTLCNLLLEFSPSKEPILESGGVELLCSLTKRPDPALRLNGIWALMNVAFQAEQRVKSQILSCLGTDQIFRLLADPELAVLMKTLGLLRNLLSTKAHIDRIMDEHAAHVMQAVILVLEDPEHPADVKEQALCILANVADGDRARDHIMANEDVLKKLMDYMVRFTYEKFVVFFITRQHKTRDFNLKISPPRVTSILPGNFFWNYLCKFSEVQFSDPVFICTNISTINCLKTDFHVQE